MKKLLALLLALGGAVGAPAFADFNPHDDTLRLGNKQASNAKTLIFDINQGSSDPQVSCSSSTGAITVTSGTSSGTYPFIFPTNTPVAGDVVTVTSSSGATAYQPSTATLSGTLILWAGSTCPSGYLAADGTSYLQSSYSALYSAIGTAWGSADSTHFNVPDLRGVVPRGVDGSAGRDPDKSSRSALYTGGNSGASVGSYEGDMYASHNHGVNDPGHSHTEAWASSSSGGAAYDAWTTPGTSTQGNTLQYSNGVPTSTSTTGISIQNSGGNETRGKNVYVTYCIKY